VSEMPTKPVFLRTDAELQRDPSPEAAVEIDARNRRSTYYTGQAPRPPFNAALGKGGE
jgi:hypothetical protein